MILSFFSKVQQEVLQKRQKEKREMLDAVKKFRKGKLFRKTLILPIFLYPLQTIFEEGIKFVEGILFSCPSVCASLHNILFLLILKSLLDLQTYLYLQGKYF